LGGESIESPQTSALTRIGLALLVLGGIGGETYSVILDILPVIPRCNISRVGGKGEM
jgi:hypothetical protein